MEDNITTIEELNATIADLRDEIASLKDELADMRKVSEANKADADLYRSWFTDAIKTRDRFGECLNAIATIASAIK